MLLVITPRPFADMGQRTIIRHRRYVISISQLHIDRIFSQGELEHRRVKRFYKTANKANFTEGIARRQRRERILHKMSQGEPSAEKAKKDDPLPPTAPESRYHMSANTKSYSDIYEWIGERSEDTAFQVSIGDPSL